MELNIFLFEDSDKDAQSIFKAFAKLSNAEVSFEFIWFKMPLSTRIDRNNHVPIEFYKTDKIVPDKIVVRKGKIHKEICQQKIFYQGDFDAAIIDMYYGELDEGRKYIRWFELCSFIRPIVAVSRMNNPTEMFSELPLLKKIAKDAKGSWLAEVGSYIANSSNLLSDIFPKTNCFGIAPEHVLREYFKAYKQASHRKYSKGDLMNYLWISITLKSDPDLRIRVKRFFSIENFLNFSSDISERYGTMQFDPDRNFPDAFLNPEVKKRNSEPHVIFIELDNINPTLLQKLVKLFFDKNGNDKAIEPPLICLIANRYIDLSSADFNEIIYRYGFLIISKDEFSSANSFKWIKRSVDALQSSWFLYEKLAETKSGNPLIRQLETSIAYYYLQILLFARAKATIYDTGTPSIIDWINGSISATPLHSGFTKGIHKLITRVIESGQLHHRYNNLTGK